ncbi:MAG: hypothetical protein N4A61_07800 [Pelagimonas sp.]|nr:hypothetical protein [Pelagimonas sp.]
MRKMFLGLTFAAVASAAQAGGYSEPKVTPPVVAQAAQESSAPSANLVIILSTLIVFGAAAGQ